MRRIGLCAALAVQLAACRGSKPEQRPGEASGTPVATPDALAAMPDLPPCTQKARFERIPAVPGRFVQGVAVSHGRMVAVGIGRERTRDTEIEVHVLDLATLTWRTMPSRALPDQSTLDIASSANHRFVTALPVRGDRARAHVLDLERGTWSEGGEVPPAKLHFTFVLDGGALVVPVRPCGVYQLERAVRVPLARPANVVASTPALAMRRRPVWEIVDGKLVLWSGDSLVDPPATGDIGCEDTDKVVPLRDGAVLDPATWTWTAMPEGPPGFPDRVWASIGHSLVVYGVLGKDRSLWRYDVRAHDWKRLGDLPAAFGRDRSYDEPHDATRVGDSLVLLHGGTAAPSAVIVDVTAGTLRELAAPPPVVPAFVSTLGGHVVVAQRKPPWTSPYAYLADPQRGSWCKLRWTEQEPFFDDGASPYYRATVPLDDGRLLLWGPGSTGEGLVVTLE